MSKINQNSYSLNTSGGAFKVVEIFEHYVKKMARDEEMETYKPTVSYAYNNLGFRDKDGKFHESWIRTEYLNNSNYGSQEDCELEMYREFTFANRKKHLPIVTPILEGDEYCYVMPRVKTKDDLGLDIYNFISKPYVQKRLKKIKLAVVNKLNKIGIKINYRQFKYRTDNIAEFGIAAGLKDEKIINNLFWFVMEDFYSGIIGDMHFSNLGLYRGNIVALDMGQIGIDDYKNPRKQFSKRSINGRY